MDVTAFPPPEAYKLLPGTVAADSTLTICYLPQPQGMSYCPCRKRKGKTVLSVMLFWCVGFAALGWLVFKIAERM